MRVVGLLPARGTPLSFLIPFAPEEFFYIDARTPSLAGGVWLAAMPVMGSVFEAIRSL